MLQSQIRPQFSKTSLVLESAVFWYIWNTADSMARLNFENCGRICDCNTSLFLLATRILPASPNFGQAKHGQNGPAATVCQQGICCPICGHYFTHWTHPDISLPFRALGRRLKNFRFSRIFISLWWKKSSACCGLNFDATDLPNSSFEPLYNWQLSDRTTVSVDNCQTIGFCQTDSLVGDNCKILQFVKGQL